MFSRVATSTVKRTAQGSNRRLATTWSGDLTFSSPESDFLLNALPRSKQAKAFQEWSRSMSYASPESDFKSSFESHHLPTPPAEWSTELSFASPEGDFTCDPNAPAPKVEWSNQYSFSSPESDFKSQNLTLSQQQSDLNVDLIHQSPLHSESVAASAPVWSGDFSFASPESDFSVHSIPNLYPLGEKDQWTNNISFASPESDFLSSFEEHHLPSPPAEWSTQLSFASPEADFTCNPTAPDMEWSSQYSFASPESDFVTMSLPQVKEQRNNTLFAQHPLYHQSIAHPESALGEIPVHQLISSLPVEPLPRSLEDAMRDTRAVVITSATRPFDIVAVNDAWVGLCGYERSEAKSLKVLQGQATNQGALEDLMKSLLQGQEGQTVVTNYKKSGATFLNHVRAGVIRDEQSRQVTHFVGVLQEIHEEHYRTMSA